jgi:Ca2+-binding RTX toxin-like protein
LAAATGVASVGLVVACEPAPVRCLGQVATIVGTSGDDMLVGTAGPDVIAGLAGKDTIQGLGADDVLCGGPGVDNVQGGDGHDTIDGSADTDRLDGGAGQDTLTYQESPHGVQVFLNRGDGGDLDVISTFEDVVGSNFDDWLVGDAGDNRLVGLAGSDTLTGDAGNDQLLDSGSTDPNERNLFFGMAGNDIYYGGQSLDIADFHASAAPSIWVNLSSGLAFGDGDDVLSGIDQVVGTSGNDTLIGDAGPNILDGWSGDDYLQGNSGSDWIIGREGRDTASWYGSPVPVTVNLAQNFASSAEGWDTLATVEDITGGNGGDTLAGDANSNIIDGSNGADFCAGGGGLDTFFRCEGF